MSFCLLHLLLSSASASVAESSAAPRPASPTQKLLRDGYVVFDGVLSAADTLAARERCEKLLSSGKLQNLGQEGRDDAVVGLPPGTVLHDRETYGELLNAARVLMSLPSMLVQGAKSDGDTPTDSMEQFERCAAPAQLMLACYPPSAGRYVSHLDNDPMDPNQGMEALHRTLRRRRLRRWLSLHM